MARLTVPKLRQMKRAGEKIAMLTVYDASFAGLMSDNGVDILLVGDSLGMVIRGEHSTVPVTLEDIAYHTRCVARGAGETMILADMPFMSFCTEEEAMRGAKCLLQAGATMVKIEGRRWLAPTVQKLTEVGVPVCCHIGLTPQTVNQLGGYKVQGRDQHSAQELIADAQCLQAAGAEMLLVECIPAALTGDIVAVTEVPVIGIGAGVAADGQVLVSYDMLGISSGYPKTFVRNFLQQGKSIAEAVASYVQAVKSADFPNAEECFK